MAEKVITAEYHWRLRVNTPESRRERIGAWLDRLATRIDGRPRTAYKISTVPEIPRVVMLECISTGHVMVERSLESACRAEAEESVLRQWCPELFAD
jgi:hypothetical protein